MSANMNLLNILGGIALIVIGIWLAFTQAKKLAEGKPNTLGGISNLLIIGIGCVICGIILIVKHI